MPSTVTGATARRLTAEAGSIVSGIVKGALTTLASLALCLALTACPSGSTQPAGDVTDTAATIQARGNTNGTQTDYWFEYGPTIAYGFQTEARDAGSARVVQTVTERITGLLPGVTYHFRAVARQGTKLYRGADRSFTTTLPVDVTPPLVALTEPSDGSATGDTTPAFAGTAGGEAGDSGTVTVKVHNGAGVAGTALQVLTTTHSGGSWSVEAAGPLPGGVYTAQAEQSDLAGNTGRSSAVTFELVPDAGTPDPVVAAAGDIACDRLDPSYNGGQGTVSHCRHRYTSDLLVGGRLAAVLPLGDIQYEAGTLANFRASYDSTWGRVKPISHPVPGNHEYATPGAAGYFDYFGAAAGARSEGYYSFDIGAWHLVALNSNCSAVGGCGAGSAQERWLRADLTAHPSGCTLAYWHHPRFSSGATHGNHPAMQALWQALYDHGVEAVLAGHDHGYERFAPQTAIGAADPIGGVREFVVGTGGKGPYAFSMIVQPNSEVRSSAASGVLELRLQQGGYHWSFLPEAGKTFTDSGSDSCH